MANQIVFNPGEESDLEDISVSFEGSSIVFKRGVARNCPQVLADALLKQDPKKFQSVAGATPTPSEA